MNLDEMIEVLEAAHRGEKIELEVQTGIWIIPEDPKWNFRDFNYRIAPKSGTYTMTLVEELRGAFLLNGSHTSPTVCQRAADRIEELESDAYDADNEILTLRARVKELEGFGVKRIDAYTTDELLDELKRRTSC